MTFKQYLEMLIHVTITGLILLTPTTVVCLVLYGNISDCIVGVCGVVTGLFMLYPTVKYIEWASRRF